MEEKHSGLGIASCVIGGVAGLGTIGVLILALIVRAVLRHNAHFEAAPTARIIFGVLALGLLLMELVALGLGIAGCAQADRKKLFAILGTVFAAVPLLVSIVAAVALA